jgi:hypothetical protein
VIKYFNIISGNVIILVFIRNSVHYSMVDKKCFIVCEEFPTDSVILAKY